MSIARVESIPVSATNNAIAMHLEDASPSPDATVRTAPKCLGRLTNRNGFVNVLRLRDGTVGVEAANAADPGKTMIYVVKGSSGQTYRADDKTQYREAMKRVWEQINHNSYNLMASAPGKDLVRPALDHARPSSSPRLAGINFGDLGNAALSVLSGRPLTPQQQRAVQNVVRAVGQIPVALQPYTGKVYGGTVTAQPLPTFPGGKQIWKLEWEGPQGIVGFEVQLRGQFSDRNLANGSFAKTQIANFVNSANREQAAARAQTNLQPALEPGKPVATPNAVRFDAMDPKLGLVNGLPTGFDWAVNQVADGFSAIANNPLFRGPDWKESTPQQKLFAEQRGTQALVDLTKAGIAVDDKGRFKLQNTEAGGRELAQLVASSGQAGDPSGSGFGNLMKVDANLPALTKKYGLSHEFLKGFGQARDQAAVSLGVSTVKTVIAGTAMGLANNNGAGLNPPTQRSNTNLPPQTRIVGGAPTTPTPQRTGNIQPHEIEVSLPRPPLVTSQTVQPSSSHGALPFNVERWTPDAQIAGKPGTPAPSLADGNTIDIEPTVTGREIVRTVQRETQQDSAQARKAVPRGLPDPVTPLLRGTPQQQQALAPGNPPFVPGSRPQTPSPKPGSDNVAPRPDSETTGKDIAPRPTPPTATPVRSQGSSPTPGGADQLIGKTSNYDFTSVAPVGIDSSSPFQIASQSPILPIVANWETLSTKEKVDAIRESDRTSQPLSGIVEALAEKKAGSHSAGVDTTNPEVLRTQTARIQMEATQDIAPVSEKERVAAEERFYDQYGQHLQNLGFYVPGSTNDVITGFVNGIVKLYGGSDHFLQNMRAGDPIVVGFAGGKDSSTIFQLIRWLQLHVKKQYGATFKLRSETMLQGGLPPSTLEVMRKIFKDTGVVGDRSVELLVISGQKMYDYNALAHLMDEVRKRDAQRIAIAGGQNFGFKPRAIFCDMCNALMLLANDKVMTPLAERDASGQPLRKAKAMLTGDSMAEVVAYLRWLVGIARHPSFNQGEALKERIGDIRDGVPGYQNLVFSVANKLAERLFAEGSPVAQDFKFDPSTPNNEQVQWLQLYGDGFTYDAGIHKSRLDPFFDFQKDNLALSLTESDCFHPLLGLIWQAQSMSRLSGLGRLGEGVKLSFNQALEALLKQHYVPLMFEKHIPPFLIALNLERFFPQATMERVHAFINQRAQPNAMFTQSEIHHLTEMINASPLDAQETARTAELVNDMARQTYGFTPDNVKFMLASPIPNRGENLREWLGEQFPDLRPAQRAALEQRMREVLEDKLSDPVVERFLVAVSGGIEIANLRHAYKTQKLARPIIAATPEKVLSKLGDSDHQQDVVRVRDPYQRVIDIGRPGQDPVWIFIEGR